MRVTRACKLALRGAAHAWVKPTTKQTSTDNFQVISNYSRMSTCQAYQPSIRKRGEKKKTNVSTAQLSNYSKYQKNNSISSNTFINILINAMTLFNKNLNYTQLCIF